MLQALVRELKSLSDIEPIILLDRRCSLEDVPERARIVYLEQNQQYQFVVEKMLPDCDLFWPIAPETDDVLSSLAELAQKAKVGALLSTPSALRLCASKYRTCRHLRRSKINAVETKYLSDVSPLDHGAMVVKPDDGVGCEGSFVVFNRQEWQHVVDKLAWAEHYIVQPYLPGRSLSLSCLFRLGQGWLLCCNEQELLIDKGRLQLTACRVNVADQLASDYQALVERVAAAIPGLWGYAGIDLIESEQNGAVVLEINPRLTTSYCGIQAATGINVAEQVIKLLDKAPALSKSVNQTITVDIHAGIH